MVNSEDSLWSHMLSVNILCKVSIKVCRCVWTYAIQTLECVIHISWTVYMKVQWKVNGFAFEDLNRQCSCILPLLSNKQNRYVYEMSMTFKQPKGILLIQLCSHVLCSNPIIIFFFSWKQIELQSEKVADWLREMWWEGCVHNRYIWQTVLELNILSSFPVWDLSHFIHQEPSSIISVLPQIFPKSVHLKVTLKARILLQSYYTLHL